MTPMTKTEQLIQRWRGPSPADPYCGNNSTAITGGATVSTQGSRQCARSATLLFYDVLHMAYAWQSPGCGRAATITGS